MLLLLLLLLLLLARRLCLGLLRTCAEDKGRDETRHRAENGHTAQHQEKRHETATSSYRRDIAVPDGGHRRRRPPQCILSRFDVGCRRTCLEDEHCKGAQQPAGEGEEADKKSHRKRPRLGQQEAQHLRRLHDAEHLEDAEAARGPQRPPDVAARPDRHLHCRGCRYARHQVEERREGPLKHGARCRGRPGSLTPAQQRTNMPDEKIQEEEGADRGVRFRDDFLQICVQTSEGTAHVVRHAPL